jgi:hypothetical protein
MENQLIPPKSQAVFYKIVSVLILLGTMALVILLVWGGIKFLLYLFLILPTLDTNIAAAIIAASATIVTSVSAVVLGKYFQAKAERKAAHRDKKVELYDTFLKKLFDIFLGSDEGGSIPEDFVPFLRDIQRKLILWSGPEVIKTYAAWHKELTARGESPKAKSMIRMIDFFLALRKDLGHSNKSIKHEYLVRFMLREPGLFMRMLKENPDITFGEIASAEELLKKAKKISSL